MRMRICLEATSLLGSRSGVGHTTALLARALVERDGGVEVVLFPLSGRGGASLPRVTPRHPRIRALAARIPASVMLPIWRHISWPPAELFAGPMDVFHGTNYVLPPLRSAAGVVTIHDLSFVRMPETCSEPVRRYADIVPSAVRRATRIVVPSEFVADELAEWIPEVADRIRVVSWGVRKVFLSPTHGDPGHPRLIEPPYAMYLGNLEPRKNLEALQQAFAEIRADRPEIRLLLVGRPAWGWERIAGRFARQLASGEVVQAGYLPDHQVADLIRSSRVFVYPSRYEGFGLPPLEAMACGAPVIATNAGALPETLGGHARLVRPNSVPDLAKALAEAFDRDPEPGAVESARRWARQFTWERTASQTLDVYREAVSARRR
jgi:glycosyltransferase involved in cell wall biosynthesis